MFRSDGKRMGYKCCMLMLIAWCTGVLVYQHSGISEGLKIKLNSSIFKEHGNAVDAVINTVGCIIPSITLYDSVSRKLMKRATKIKSCVNIIDLVERNTTHMWIVKENEKYYFSYSIKHYANKKPKVECYYKPFYRPNKIDNIASEVNDERLNFKPSIQFSIIKPSDEFILVECQISNKTVYRNLFLFAQKKSFIPRNAVGAAGQLNETNSVYNVLVIGVDSVSRLNLHRTMPKTVTYLKQLDAVELLGYNKIGDNTFPNVIGVLLGIKENEIKNVCYPHSEASFDNCPLIWEWYKQNGFFTAYGEDGDLGIFNFYKRGFINTPTDYYMHPFMYERAKYSPVVCPYGHQVTLRYIVDLTAILSANRLFGFFWESTISHNYLQDAKLLDPDYFNLFKTLNDSKYLNKTIVFFISDHGIRAGEYARTRRGRMESRLPFVFILTPQSFRSKYKEAYKNLKINSNRLTTPMDLHETLIELMTLNSITDSEILNRTKESSNGNKRSISLFLPIPETRTCRSAGIEDTWCSCHNGKPVPITLKKVHLGAEFMIKYLNNLMLPFEKCAYLQIEKIMDAFEITAVYNSSVTMLRIVVEVKPGGGIFEGTVRHEFNRFSSIGGPLNRLNAYGKQSFCIEQYYYKMYCYCEHQES